MDFIQGNRSAFESCGHHDGGAWTPPPSHDSSFGNWENSEEFVGVTWEETDPLLPLKEGPLTDRPVSPQWPPALGWTPWSPTGASSRSSTPSLVYTPALSSLDGSEGGDLMGLDQLVADCRVSLGERFENSGVVVGHE
jgi:hypothetical protein